MFCIPVFLHHFPMSPRRDVAKSPLFSVHTAFTLFHAILWGEGGARSHRLYPCRPRFVPSRPQFPLFSLFNRHCRIHSQFSVPPHDEGKHTPDPRSKHTKHTMKSRKHTKTRADFFPLNSQLTTGHYHNPVSRRRASPVGIKLLATSRLSS